MENKRMVEAYQAQARKARRREIPFLISFEDWCEWWLTDDRWANRGLKRGQFVMARRNDVGPYELSNIYCATNEQNHADVPRIVRVNAGHKTHITKLSRGSAYEHLRSDVHPRCAAVKTPDGNFLSIEKAALHYGVTGRCIRYRLASWDGWERAA